MNINPDACPFSDSPFSQKPPRSETPVYTITSFHFRATTSRTTRILEIQQKTGFSFQSGRNSQDTPVQSSGFSESSGIIRHFKKPLIKINLAMIVHFNYRHDEENQ
jgi:hypothetical protein